MTPLDDRLPDQPEPEPETDVEEYRRMKLAEQGLVERNGVYFCLENDVPTRSILTAMVRELNEHLHVVNQAYAALEQDYQAIVSVQRTTLATAERAISSCERLAAERDKLEGAIARYKERDTI